MLTLVRSAETLARRLAADDSDVAALHGDAAWQAVMDACADLGELPSTFLHGDLWLPNIVDRGDAIGFLDAGGSGWGPNVLSLWRLLDRLRANGLSEAAEALVTSYVSSWPGRGSRPQMARAISWLEVTSRVLRLKAQFAAARLPVARSLSEVDGPAPVDVEAMKDLLRAVRLCLTGVVERPHRFRENPSTADV